MRTKNTKKNGSREANNRPISFTQGRTRVECNYDYMGRQSHRKVYKNGSIYSTTNERYIYRGYLRLGVVDMNGGAFLYQALLWDPTEPQVTRPLALLRNKDSYYYGHDFNKNVTELFNANGDIVNHYDYRPYGALLKSSESIPNPIQYSSEVYDPELGLFYYNYRHYNPEDGRWLTRDPIGEQDDLNLYGFVRNNPIFWFDSLGLNKEKCCDRVTNIQVEYATDTHCCEEGKVVAKVQVYIINRSGGNPDTGTTGGHIDLIIPGSGLIGYFGVNNRGASNGIGIGLDGYMNNTWKEWTQGIAARKNYVIGKGNMIAKGVLSTICEITVCPKNAQQMSAKVSLIDATPGNFDMVGNNCSTQACVILGSGGIMKDGINGLDTPQNLMEQIQSGYKTNCYYGYTKIDSQTSKATVIPEPNAPAIPKPDDEGCTILH